MPTINSLVNKKTRRIKKYHCNPVRALKSNPQKKAICIKVRIVKPKKPNSAQRKIVKVKLNKKRSILAYIPGQGHTSKSYFHVLINGGRANDLPGLRLSLIRGKYDFTSRENFIRMHKRSKYGQTRQINTSILSSNENEEG